MPALLMRWKAPATQVIIRSVSKPALWKHFTTWLKMLNPGAVLAAASKLAITASLWRQNMPTALVPSRCPTTWQSFRCTLAGCKQITKNNVDDGQIMETSHSFPIMIGVLVQEIYINIVNIVFPCFPWMLRFCWRLRSPLSARNGITLQSSRSRKSFHGTSTTLSKSDRVDETSSFCRCSCNPACSSASNVCSSQLTAAIFSKVLIAWWTNGTNVTRTPTKRDLEAHGFES